MDWWVIILWVICALVIISVITYFAVGEICYLIALRRRNIIGMEVNMQLLEMMDTFKIDYSWWEEVNTKVVSIKAFDDIKLSGAIVENKKAKKRVAIVVHGYMANYKDMQRYAELFYDLNFNVIVPDNRGHGLSDGKCVCMGFKDKYDILMWIKYAMDKFGDDCEILVMGLSMGASTVCMLSGENLPSNVKCLISDCGYDSVFNVFKSTVEKRVKIPMRFTLAIFNSYAKLRVGFSLKEADATKTIENCKKPILIIHGKKDQLVPFEMHEKLYNHAPKELREKYVFENAQHAESLPKNPTEYANVVKDFIKRKFN